MSDLDTWSALVGSLLPLAIAFFMQSTWDQYAKIALTVTLCLVAAVGTVYFKGELDTSNLIHSMLTIVALAWGTYQIVWKPTTITARIEAAVPI